MKIVGFLVCGPNEADRYLKGTLEEFKRLCDEVMVVCNNTDKKTEAMIQSYGYDWYRDDREWGRHQPTIKTDLLRKIGETYNPDWIVPLDADEQFGHEVTRAELERLAQTESLAYYFYIVNMWNDEQHYKKSISFWNIRYFKYAPEWGTQFLKRNVHCGLAPPHAYHYGRYAPHIVRHYGLLRMEDRMKKVERYKKYDPNADKVGIGGWYEALADRGLGSEYNEDQLQAKVREEVSRMQQNLNKQFSMNKPERTFVFLRNPKSNREFEVPKSKVGHYLSQGCEIIGEVNLPSQETIEAPVIDEPVKEEVVEQVRCDICDYEAKTETAVKRHKTMKHKDE